MVAYLPIPPILRFLADHNKEDLRVARNELGNPSATYVAQAIGNNKKLKELDLGMNEITMFLLHPSTEHLAWLAIIQAQNACIASKLVR